MAQQVILIEEPSLSDQLVQITPGTVDFALMVSGGLSVKNGTTLFDYLDLMVNALKPGGLLFVQVTPQSLASIGVYLDAKLNFKYWIVLESEIIHRPKGLPTVHAGLLLFVKGAEFKVEKIRVPHEYCSACNKTRKDWGGKAHLMNPEGYAISDVWKDSAPENNYTRLSQKFYKRILQMVDYKGRDTIGVIAPAHSVLPEQFSPSFHEPVGDYQLSLFSTIIQHQKTPPIPKNEDDFPGFNVVLEGDAEEILKKYPDEAIDLVFADPPYNLDKSYGMYEDERGSHDYLNWCNRWLDEYIRVLKPSGSLFVLNLPKWSMYHADYLNQRLVFQNWIAWDALSEPRGKLLPAHYGLLHYTKHKENFTFNQGSIGEIDSRIYCLRGNCGRSRKSKGDDLKEPLTDLWWDIHRIKHRRDRDYHPCQLPDSLLKRIILLTTKPQDIVLDALAGTGTTAIVAAKLNRRYVAIDLDPTYVQLMRQKLAEIRLNGDVIRTPINKTRVMQYSKKELQLELRHLARKLGRLPTPEDVKELSRFDLDIYLKVFPTWGKAIKAAKLEIHNEG